MTKNSLSRAACALMLQVGAAATAQPSFQGLGDLANGAFESSADAISADGTVAVVRATVRLRGIGAGAQPYAVLRWQEGDVE